MILWEEAYSRNQKALNVIITNSNSTVHNALLLFMWNCFVLEEREKHADRRRRRESYSSSSEEDERRRHKSRSPLHKREAAKNKKHKRYRNCMDE